MNKSKLFAVDWCDFRGGFTYLDDKKLFSCVNNVTVSDLLGLMDNN